MAPNTQLSIEDIARVAHEVSRKYALAIGDSSLLPWEDSPKWQQDSIMAGVRLHLDAPRSPRDSHEAWVKYKAAEGWVYGPVKDIEKKEHPCMVPYEELSIEDRAKDHVFAGVVEQLSRYVVRSMI